MESCKDCVHYEACKMFFVATNQGITEEKIKQAENDLTDCEQFKAKSRFVELPCKVGDVLWICSSVRGVFSAKVRTFFIGHPSFQGEPDNSIQMIRTTGCDIPINEFGKTVFLTREAAEKALKERE